MGKNLFRIPEIEMARFINRKIKRNIIIPELRLRKNCIGNLYHINISYVEYESEYDKRLDILKMLNKGLFHVVRNYRKSNYYNYQVNQKGRSERYTVKKIIKYYLLYRSIKKDGFKVDYNNLASFPWLFSTKNFFVRLDGHHRVSAARFLGYEEIPVLLITPKDLLGLANLSDDVVNFLKKLEEPEIPDIRPYV